MPALQIGLNKPRGGLKGPSKPTIDRRKPVFGEDEDEEEEAQPSAFESTTLKPTSKPNIQEISTFDETSPHPSATKPTSKPSAPSQNQTKPALKSKFPSQQHTAHAPNLSALRTQTQHTTDVDPSIYNYDAAYDALHAQASKSTSSGKAPATGPEAHYMSDLLAAAEVRKRDQLRAKERLLQKEREAEGDEFVDKEMFVTEAYKAQQEEVKKAEAMEAEREALEAKRRGKGLGMSKFYRGFMEQEEARHREMMEAVASAPKVEGAGDMDGKGSAEKSDADAAEELKGHGKHVDLNEEGQILDKRELLSAGLNVVSKPKGAAAEKSTSSVEAAQRQDYTQGSHGRNDARRAMRDRQTRMMEAQLEQAAKRNAEEEVEEQQRLERAAKSQKTEGDVSSAKERYLQRKREAAAAAGRA